MMISNPNNKIKVLLIEFTSSHFEWIYTQSHFLKDSEFQLNLAIDISQKARIDDLPKNEIFIFNFFNKSFLNNLKNLIALRRLIKKNKYQIVIFNTAHNIYVRNFLLILPDRVNSIGILHRGQNLIRSTNQKIITKKIDGYFVLAEYQKQHLTELTNKPLNVIYNTYFRYHTSSKESNTNDFYCVIPGAVESYRRDYQTLVEQCNKSDLPDNIRFIFLGKMNKTDEYSKRLSELIASSKHKDKFIIFDEFIDDELYSYYLENADLLLPLIHPKMDNFINYLNYQISGTFNLSYAYQIPMLIEQSFSRYDEFRISSAFYQTNELVDRIKFLYQNRNIIKDISRNITVHEEFSFEYQKSNYINTLKSLLNKKNTCI